MIERFARYASRLFGIAMPVALAVMVLGPVAFVRGLGAAALACAALGHLINALVLRAAHRQAYRPVPPARFVQARHAGGLRPRTPFALGAIASFRARDSHA